MNKNVKPTPPIKVELLSVKILKEVIKPWLAERWRNDNAPKYAKYFEGWFSRITDNQVFCFYKQMITKL